MLEVTHAETPAGGASSETMLWDASVQAQEGYPQCAPVLDWLPDGLPVGHG